MEIQSWWDQIADAVKDCWCFASGSHGIEFHASTNDQLVSQRMFCLLVVDCFLVFLVLSNRRWINSSVSTMKSDPVVCPSLIWLLLFIRVWVLNSALPCSFWLLLSLSLEFSAINSGGELACAEVFFYADLTVCLVSTLTSTAGNFSCFLVVFLSVWLNALPCDLLPWSSTGCKYLQPCSPVP